MATKIFIVVIGVGETNGRHGTDKHGSVIHTPCRPASGWNCRWEMWCPKSPGPPLKITIGNDPGNLRLRQVKISIEMVPYPGFGPRTCLSGIRRPILL